MKKASKVILGGLVGATSAVANAGITVVDPGAFDVSATCKPDFEASYENAYGCYEASVRCDGDDGLYGICIAGSFDADIDNIYASWAAFFNGSTADATDCNNNPYGFYGLAALGYGGGGDLVAVNGFDATPLNKLESKATTTSKGNGKPGKNGSHGATSEDITVEVEFKRVECED